MLDAKLFEIRDAGTFIPVLAVLMQPSNMSDGPRITQVQAEAWLAQRRRDRYLLSRAGYGETQLVVMHRLTDSVGLATYDPYAWPGAPRNRTMSVAHEYVTKHWHLLESGDVIDVEFILGLTAKAKRSESDGDIFNAPQQDEAREAYASAFDGPAFDRGATALGIDVAVFKPQADEVLLATETLNNMNDETLVRLAENLTREQRSAASDALASVILRLGED